MRQSKKLLSAALVCGILAGASCYAPAAVWFFVVFLCAVCTTTTFAAGEGFRAGYDRVFESTKVEIEEEVP